MTIKEIFLNNFDLRIKEIEKFDIFELEKYFNKDEDRYKHTLGVVSNMQSLLKQSDFNEEEKNELMTIAYLHDIGHSRRIKNRGLTALDSALFAIEKGFSQNIALGIMFHTAAAGEARLIGGKIANIYAQAKILLMGDEKMSKYLDYITFANLHTELDGMPTKLNRRIFKILASNPKDSNVYKNIKHNKRNFKQLKNRVLTGFIKERNWWEEFVNVLLDRR